MLKILVTKKYYNPGEIARVIPVKKDKIISITLQFFKSVNPDLYNHVKSIIFNQNKKIKLNIYDAQNITDFKQTDLEFKDMEKYNYEPLNNYKNNKDIIYIPLRRDSNISRSIKKDEGTLDDLFIIVHEIAHSFDINLEFGPNEERDKKIYKFGNILTETTAISFERMLADYLVENNLFKKDDMEQILKRRLNNSSNKAIFVYAQLFLSRKKEENGEITKKDIQELIKEFDSNIQSIKKLGISIINDAGKEMLSNSRYAIAGILSPTIEKIYKEKEFGKIQGYLKESKNGNFKDAFYAIGITLDDEGLNKLKENIENQRYEFESQLEER